MIEQFIDEGINPGSILYVSFDNPIVKLVSVENVLSIYESDFDKLVTKVEL